MELTQDKLQDVGVCTMPVMCAGWNVCGGGNFAICVGGI